jgi:hypothetical protein
MKETCFDFQLWNDVIVLSTAQNPTRSPVPCVPEFLSLEIANQGMKLTPHLHQVDLYLNFPI